MNRRFTTATQADRPCPAEVQLAMEPGAGSQRQRNDEGKLGGATEATKECVGEQGDAVLPRWEHFDHGADIGVRGLGQSKSVAFEQAALALTAVVADPARVVDRETVRVKCEAADDELLLAAWLNAVVTEMAVRGMLFSRFHVDLRGRALCGSMVGEPVSPERHEPAVEVKGATYTELRVRQLPDGSWLAQTVVDV